MKSLSYFSLKHDGTRDSKLKGDALNKKIALDFIDSLRGTKDSLNEDLKEDKVIDFKPKFRQSSNKNDDNHKIDSKRPTFQSSHGGKARVMETFEFGKSSGLSKSKGKQTKMEHSGGDSSSETTKSKDKASKCGRITLNYYEDEEEEEEEA